jgi:hypothetical protein
MQGGKEERKRTSQTSARVYDAFLLLLSSLGAAAEGCAAAAEAALNAPPKGALFEGTDVGRAGSSASALSSFHTSPVGQHGQGVCMYNSQHPRLRSTPAKVSLSNGPYRRGG